MKEVTAYLGLGSNLGSRWGKLRLALGMLEEPEGEIRVLRTSQVYETPPWGFADQPDFLNCVAEVTTALEPYLLLRRAKEVEEELGRQPGPLYGPRPIDVDILLYDELVLDEPTLQIPHPRLHLRAFALVPLAELAASLRHPVLNDTIGHLAETIEDSEGLKPMGPLS